MHVCVCVYVCVCVFHLRYVSDFAYSPIEWSDASVRPMHLTRTRTHTHTHTHTHAKARQTPRNGEPHAAAVVCACVYVHVCVCFSCHQVRMSVCNFVQDLTRACTDASV